MAQKIELEKGEVKELPPPKHHNVIPLVARTDDVMGTGEELIVVTPGKNGLKILPYGSIFHDYEHLTNQPIFELPDGTFSNAPRKDVELESGPTSTPQLPIAPAPATRQPHSASEISKEKTTP